MIKYFLFFIFYSNFILIFSLYSDIFLCVNFSNNPIYFGEINRFELDSQFVLPR